jgi:uncharacterized membrane protein YraQ (UPF0718 family)
MKDLAGAYVAASFVFLSELILGKVPNDKLNEYMEIEESDDISAQSSHFLPKIFLKKSKVLNTIGREFQDTTKSMIYGILILVTILVLLVKWGQALG